MSEGIPFCGLATAKSYSMAFTTIALLAYIGIVLVMSLVSFAVYGFDKHRAIHGGRRVPESTLHMLAFFGGWPGALLAQRMLRHKTKKTSFLIVFWIVVVLHVGVVGAVAYAIYRSPFAEHGKGSDYTTILTQRSKGTNLEFEFTLTVKDGVGNEPPNFLCPLSQGPALEVPFAIIEAPSRVNETRRADLLAGRILPARIDSQVTHHLTGVKRWKSVELGSC